MLLVAGITTSNKKLLVTKGIARSYQVEGMGSPARNIGGHVLDS